MVQVWVDVVDTNGIYTKNLQESRISEAGILVGQRICL